MDFTPATYVARVEQAADLADSDRDAVLLWLRHALVPAIERQRLAATIMTSSVYAQAALYGLVACSRCGDRGCDWCRGVCGDHDRPIPCLECAGC